MKTEPGKKAKMTNSVEQLSVPKRKINVPFFREEEYCIVFFLP